MKRQILEAGSFPSGSYEDVVKALSEGWVLDPAIHRGEPFGLENVIVYHLVFYEPEEDKPKTVEEARKPGALEDVESIISVEIPLVKHIATGEVSTTKSDIDKFISEGYVILENYAKTATLIKRKQKEVAKPMEAENKE